MLHYFRPQSGSVKNDVLSGLTVSLALVPEAIAFAFVAGVSPIIGLYSAFFIGLIAAVLGGRPGMISGATGAMAVVVVALVAQHGIAYLFPTVILCGLLQIGIGIARLGKFIRMVPRPVMLGFVNGLAIVIGLAQLGSFKTLGADGYLEYITGTRMVLMLIMVLLTMSIIWLLPKFTTAVPASLVAILSVSLIAFAVNNSVQLPNPDGTSSNALATVGDMLLTNSQAKHDSHGHGASDVNTDANDTNQMAEANTTADKTNPAGISGGLPKLFFLEHAIMPINWANLKIIFPYAIILCGVGLIESLMTLTLIDEITATRGQGNRECIGQGAANVVCGLFGGMGGCAMIGQSLINVNSGGRGRLSGIVAAVCLLLFVLFLGPLITQIPMAALVGVMSMVVIGTFEWASLKMFRRMPRSDVFVMILVTAYTVLMHDLASAVILGVIVSALVFAWQHATHMGADTKYNQNGHKIYQLHGPLFFASAVSFKELFDVNEDPEDVVVDFYYTRVYDQSGLEAIHTLAEKYDECGKRLHLTHLSPECRRLLENAGDLIQISLSEFPQFHIATERLGSEDDSEVGLGA